MQYLCKNYSKFGIVRVHHGVAFWHCFCSHWVVWPSINCEIVQDSNFVYETPHSDCPSFLITKDSPNRGRIEPIIENPNGSRANLISHRQPVAKCKGKKKEALWFKADDCLLELQQESLSKVPACLPKFHPSQSHRLTRPQRAGWPKLLLNLTLFLRRDQCWAHQQQMGTKQNWEWGENEKYAR